MGRHRAVFNELVRDTMAAIDRLEDALGDPGLADRAADLGADLAERLVALYLRDSAPGTFKVASLLGLAITSADYVGPQPLVAGDGGQVTRLPWLRDSFHFERASDLLADPGGYLMSQYLPNQMSTAADAHAGAAALFPILADIARHLRVAVALDLERLGPEPIDPPPQDGEVFPDWPPPIDEAASPDPGPFDLAGWQRDFLPRLLFEVSPQSPWGLVCQDGWASRSRRVRPSTPETSPVTS